MRWHIEDYNPRFRNTHAHTTSSMFTSNFDDMCMTFFCSLRFVWNTYMSVCMCVCLSMTIEYSTLSNIFLFFTMHDNKTLKVIQLTCTQLLLSNMLHINSNHYHGYNVFFMRLCLYLLHCTKNVRGKQTIAFFFIGLS